MYRAKNELTIAAVYETAEALMALHGITTTLEVKNQLRNQGFWALQAQVSALMWQVAEQAGWRVFSNGRFRVYASDACYYEPQGPQEKDTEGFWLN